MAEHTPSPWVIIPMSPAEGDDGETVGWWPASIEGNDGSPVCTFASENGSGMLFENEADYHLIATAPDLLAVAKMARDAAAHKLGIGEEPALTPRAMYNAALAAIARAEGRQP